MNYINNVICSDKMSPSVVQIVPQMVFTSSEVQFRTDLLCYC